MDSQEFLQTVSAILETSPSPVKVKASEVCKKMGISERQFRRLFVRAGMSFRQFKNNLVYAKLRDRMAEQQDENENQPVRVKTLVSLGYSEDRSARRWLKQFEKRSQSQEPAGDEIARQ